MASRLFSGTFAVPDNPADTTCFDRAIDGVHLGLMKNSRCDTRAVWLPVTADNAAWYTVTVEGFTPAPGQEVACGLYSVNNAGTITNANWGNIPFAQDNVSLGPVPIYHSNESLVVLCFVPQGGIIFNYHW
jgi:hypothetical protein